MQGLKEQKTPSGLKHCAAEGTAYTNSAIHAQENDTYCQCVVNSNKQRHHGLQSWSQLARLLNTAGQGHILHVATASKTQQQ